MAEVTQNKLGRPPKPPRLTEEEREEFDEVTKKIEGLVTNAVQWALKAPESWDKYGALDEELFAGLVADAILVTIILPILNN